MTSPDLEALKTLSAKWRKELREVDSDRDNYSPKSADYFADELDAALERLLAGQQDATQPVAGIPVKVLENFADLLQHKADDFGKYKEHSAHCIAGTLDGCVTYLRRLAALYAAPPVQEAAREELQEAAAEVYQCVGTLLSDAGRFDSNEGLMLLDLLSWMSGNRDKRPDTDKLLPFASAEPASLGAAELDALAKELIVTFVDAKNVGYYSEGVKTVLRRHLQHQPIKAGTGKE